MKLIKRISLLASIIGFGILLSACDSNEAPKTPEGSLTSEQQKLHDECMAFNVQNITLDENQKNILTAMGIDLNSEQTEICKAYAKLDETKITEVKAILSSASQGGDTPYVPTTESKTIKVKLNYSYMDINGAKVSAQFQGSGGNGTSYAELQTLCTEKELSCLDYTKVEEFKELGDGMYEITVYSKVDDIVLKNWTISANNTGYGSYTPTGIIDVTIKDYLDLTKEY